MQHWTSLAPRWCAETSPTHPVCPPLVTGSIRLWRLSPPWGDDLAALTMPRSVRSTRLACRLSSMPPSRQGSGGSFLSPPLAWIQREVRRSSAPRSPTSGGCEHRRWRRYSCDPMLSKKTHLTPLGRFDLARGQVVVFGKGDSRTRWVSANDVAALIAAVAAEPNPPELIEFGGPEAISRNEAITIAERLTGRTIKRRHVPRPILRLGQQLLNRPHDALASLFGLLLMRDLADSNWDDTPLRQRGITPRSASDFLEEQAQSLY